MCVYINKQHHVNICGVKKYFELCFMPNFHNQAVIKQNL